MLDAVDHEMLAGRGLAYTAEVENGWTNLIISGYEVPTGFTPERTDLLVRLPPGFPDAAPDMFWADPEIRISATGQYAPASEHREQYAGRTWQRFSRHLPPGAWRPGIDSLESWLAVIRQQLLMDVGR